MKQMPGEAAYPLKFREHDSLTLADHLKHRHSIELVGMKRVGINNFLRFFLFHRHIEKKYIQEDGKNLFILVDLNDLVEKDLFAFWRLTFKRINDAVENYGESTQVKEKISAIFLRCIQTGDFFLTYDGVKESLVLLTKEGFLPTLFFTRFDRLKDIASVEFFDNLKSIRDATEHKLSYVFTSFRELSKIFPAADNNELVSRFVNTVSMKPLVYADQKIVLEKLLQKYSLPLLPPFLETILQLSGGHVQYIHLCTLITYELFREEQKYSLERFIEEITNDERITFLSEELWESLREDEQDILKKILLGKTISEEEKANAIYLWDTGFVIEKRKKQYLFSPLFKDYIEKVENEEEMGTMDLSKKEHTLFRYLQSHLHTICEREKIAEIVWPEYRDYGVSDWSIDRLVARVRSKLKKQKSEYEIVTVRTRGYKLELSGKHEA